jgi:hypothetical protein
MVQSFHIVMVDGTERNVRAASMEDTRSGALVFARQDAVPRVIIAPGQWKYVELESQDDK